MGNCNGMGLKHKLKITGSEDWMVYGHIFFQCKRCGARGAFERNYLYRMMLRPGVNPGRVRGS